MLIVAANQADLSKRLFSRMTAERVLFFVVLVNAVWIVVETAPLFSAPFQIDYGEGLMLEGAARLRHSYSLYPDPFGFPIVLHVYGPVAYAAAALLQSGGEPSFPAGRWLVLFCSMAVCLLVANVLKNWTGSWWTGLAFGLLILTLPAFRFWLYLLRADMIGIFFSVVGVALYARNNERWPWSLPFFALAIFCKYTLIAAPAAAFAHLMLSQKRKQGMAFAAALSLVCLAAFAALQLATGRWFAFHMFSSHPDPYAWSQFFALGALVCFSAPVVSLLAVWYVTRSFRGREWTFAPLYLVTSSITALTAGKLGSTTNHFLEWMIASCLCAGLGFALLAKKQPRTSRPMAVLLAASVLVSVIVQNRPSQQPSLADCGRAYEYVRDAPSLQVFSENAGPLLMAGKPVLVSDPFEYLQFVKRGLWPNRKFEELVEQRHFGLMVLSVDPSEASSRRSEVWPESLLTTIDRNYRVVERFNCPSAGLMLEPRPADEKEERPSK